MKKIYSFLTTVILMFHVVIIAQPTNPLSDFSITASTTSIIAANGLCTVPKTANIMDGWYITVSSASNCGFNIVSTGASNGHINFFGGLGGGLNYLTFGSNDGSEFAIKQIHLSVSTASGTSISMLYQGYKNGSPVSGASLYSNTPSSSFPSTVAVTFSTITAFQDVDDIRVTPQSLYTSNFQLWDVTIGTATPACTTPTLSVVSVGNVLCNGGGTGSASMSAIGGSGFTYTWLPSGGSAASATGLSAGIYTLSTSNSCGANGTQTVQITQPASALITSTAMTIPLCNGTNGSATVTASGGTSPYTYTWSSGPTSSIEPTLLAGTYTVRVNDNNGCNITRSVTITQPSALVTSTALTNALCNGANGSATVTASGGTGAYSYTWSSGPTTSVEPTLLAGTYTVKVTDANSCASTKSVTISEPTALATSTAMTPPLCNGNNGSATVTASGGTGAYSYTWSSGPTTSVEPTLLAGTYTVRVTDANNCTSTKSITVTQPSAIGTSTGYTNVFCNGGVGSASILASGGTSPFTYTWSTATTGSFITGIPAGSYTVKAIDANNCSSITRTITISQPSALATSTAVTNVLCNGGQGSATVTASGGTGAYSYTWSSGPTTSIAPTLLASTYTVRVTDANNCTNTTSVTISQPAALVSSTAASSALCGNSNGSATLTASGGTGGYTYLWSNAATTSVVAGLISGAYSATVTDANGCSSVKSISIGNTSGFTTGTIVTNVFCNGASTGAATVTTSGGLAPYTYLWSGAQTSSIITGLNAGVRTVTVTDANSCTGINTITISQPASALSATTVVTNVLCFGGNTGSATITASGGTSPYSYLASNGRTTTTNANITAGAYSYTVTDANGCTVSSPFTLTQPAAALATSTAVTNVLCFGASTGAATVTASGGTTPYTYAWSGAQTTSVISGQTSGVRTVTVTDANGCASANAASINQPGSGIITGTAVTNVLCFGNSTGAATVTASGGTGSYTYLWSSAQTTSVISGVNSGIRTVTVTDANSCTTIATANITQPSSPTLNATASSASVCSFASSTLTALGSGGTGAFTYTWVSGPSTSTQVVSPLIPTIYTVNANDANGCAVSKTVSVGTYTSPSLSVLGPPPGFSTCPGQSVSLFVSGANTYTWSTSSGTISNNSNLTVFPTVNTNYSVTGTNASGCLSFPASTLIGVAANPTITVNNPTVCQGQSAVFTPTGGITYSLFPFSSFSNTISVIQPISGTYTYALIGQSIAGCTSMVTSSVTVIATPTVANINSNVCHFGSVLITASGANSYNWYDGSTTVTGASVTVSPGTNTTYTITGNNQGCLSANIATMVVEPYVLTMYTSSSTCNNTLSALSVYTSSATYSWNTGATSPSIIAPNTNSVYSVYVTFPYFGCVRQIVYTVSPSPTISIGSTSLSVCLGQTLSLVGSGASSYTWNPGALTGTTIIISPSTAVAYSVIGSSSAGCISTNTAIANVTVNALPSITVNSGVICSGFNFTISPSGALTYTVTGGNFTVNPSSTTSYSVIGTSSLGCISSNTAISTITVNTTPTITINSGSICSGSSFTILPGGANTYTYLNGSSIVTPSASTNYSVRGTSAQGCVSSNTAVSSVFIYTKPSVTSTIVSNVSCFGGSNGSATIVVNGGTSPYSYSWSGAQTTSVISGQTSGVRTVTIADANSCAIAATVNINQPPSALTSSTTVTNVLCFGAGTGAATVSASGGTSPYTYLWSNTQTTSVIFTLPSSIITVTVTDNNNCNTTNTATITQPASALSSASAVTNVSCNGGNNGSATITASGGVSPYTYAWPSSQTTSVVSGLNVGVRTVTVTDANGCKSFKTVAILQPVALSTSTAVTNILCFGGSTGSASLFVSGGTSPYSYAWSSAQTTSIITGQTSGVRTVTITDANSCTIAATANITQPASALIGSTAVTNVLCFGASTGAASLTVSGGTSPYTYAWSGAQTTSVISGQTSGVRTVNITDANGCVTGNTVTITQPASGITTGTVVSNVLCFGAATGAATVTTSGGTSPYSYSWSGAQTTSVISGQTSGVRTVTITDANACTMVAIANITQPTSALASSTAITNVLCFGASTGAATLTASGGTSPYSYSWSGAQTTSVISGQTAGVRTVTITDANTCIVTATANITQPASALATSTAVTNVLCFGASTGAASLTVTGGTTPYSYSWSGAQTTSVISGQTSGVRTVTVTDANSCVNTRTVIITQPGSALVTSTAVLNVLCFGNSTGAATVTASGGTSPYSYLWSSAQTSSVITGQTIGVRTVTITDANACLTANTVTIIQPSALTTATNVSNVLCNGGSTGSATITALGGVTPYTFIWSSAATTSIINSLNVGVRTVTVTDANACTTSNSINVNQPSALVTSTAVLNILCFGNSTGASTVAASGGTSPYSYLWSTGQTTSVIATLTAAARTVTITDANVCTTTAVATATQPAAPLTTSINVLNVLCFGNSTGAATIIANGGTTPYSYSWSPSATGSVITSQTMGVRTFTVTDGNACNTVGTVSITQPTSITINIVSSPSAVCSGSNSALTATATGGTGAKTYTWVLGPQSNTRIVAPLASTIYTVNISDANNCIGNQTIAINPLPNPTITVSNATICAGQTYTMNPSGAFTYTFSNGGSTVSPSSNQSYSITGTSSLGCISSNTAISAITVNTLPIIVVNSGTICSGNSFTISPSGATSYTVSGGSFTTTPATNTNYTVSGTGSNGCINSTGAISQVTVYALPTMSMISGFICPGNSFTLNPIGAGTYTYLNGGPIVTPSATTSYSVIGTSSVGCPASNTVVSVVTISNNLNVTISGSANICSGQTATLIGNGASTYSWSSGATSASVNLNPLINTSYTLFGVSGNCSNTAVINVTVNTTPTISIAGTNTLCLGSNINLIASGANTYSWDSGATNASVNVSPTINTIYSVVGTTSAGCSNVGTFSTTVFLLPFISVSSGSICDGQSFTISPTGANTYTISGGLTIVTPTINSSYTITGTSAQGCDNNVGVVCNVVVNPNPTVGVSVSASVICEGETSVLTATGTTNYTWTNGANTSSVSVNPIVTTGYTVTGIDNNNCSADASITVSVNPSPTVLITSSQATLCSGQNATLTANGGSTYSWNTGGSSSTLAINPTVTTQYTVDVTGTNGCHKAAMYNQIVEICGGIDLSNQTIPTKISIYPNPSNGIFTVNLDSEDLNVGCAVYNNLGQLVLKQELHELVTDIDMRKLDNGIYHLIVTSQGNALLATKIIKQ